MTQKEKSTPRESPARPVKILLIAAWFALLVGFAEVSALTGAKLLFEYYIRKSPHVVWMAPLSNLLIFTVSGCFLFLVSLRWPKFASVRTSTGIFAFLGCLSLLLMAPRLGGWASAALAAGFAVQASHFVSGRTHAFQQLVHKSLAWMVIILVGFFFSVFGNQIIRERRAWANLPSAPADAPNVLLIVLDTVRAKNLSMYGYPRQTSPHLDRFAKSGVTFNRALSTAPWTLPSHASMFTGRYHHELSANWRRPLDGSYPTLAEAMSSRGYLTAGFVANTLFCDTQSGLSRGFLHYEDHVVSIGTIIESSSLGRTLSENQWLRRVVNNYQRIGSKSAPEVNSAFLEWLGHTDRRPFFAFLNYMDAHEPYLPPEPFDLKFGSKRPSNPELQDDRQYSPEEIGEMIDAYDGAIAYLDHHLGLLFDELETRGLLKNTLVIITSDHGEEFGEHGVMSHSNSLYLPALHVPLVISFPPKLPAGISIAEPVTLRDIPSTVVALLADNNVSFPGTSLTRYWDGTHDSPLDVSGVLLSEVNRVPNVPEWFPVAKGDMKSMVFGGMHYIRNGDGSEELYDFENDPAEKQNLVDSEEARQIVQRFRTSLETVLASNRSEK